MGSDKNIFIGLLLGLTCVTQYAWAEPPISAASQECIACHASATPGIVADWKRSRHASNTPADALKKPELQRRVSASQLPEEFSGNVVGCAECHSVNIDRHKDSFDHNDKKIHLTVTPKDCATCHPTESEQYDKNLMSHARINLAQNPVFSNLASSINSTILFKGNTTVMNPPNELTDADSCFHCHGTALELKGTRKRDTDFGEMEFPVIAGWPNQGVGRFNLDGSKGSCNSCHSKHQFSITLARKPYTCSQCHKGPDVPAYKAYELSKHGNIAASLSSEWNYKEVPWTVGKDFIAPTCATCHVSTLVSTEGEVIAKRTHQMSDRLPWRILGLIYAHPHPKSPDTSLIRNRDGQPLPVTLDGVPASEFLISPEEQEKRKATLQKVCFSCHSKNWVNGQWERFENSIKTSNDMTKTSTEILQKAWAEGLVDQKSGLFDEMLEKEWVEQWLFYANAVRLASAMMGADLGVFEQGRWSMTKNIQDMLERSKFLRSTLQKNNAPATKAK